MARVLIVDDDPLIALLASDWVEEFGHEVVGPAYTLAEGLDMARSMAIDAAFVDVSLGQDTSLPIADALAGRRIPFVIATGHEASEISEKYSLYTLIKPFRMERFREMLETLLAPPV